MQGGAQKMRRCMRGAVCTANALLRKRPFPIACAQCATRCARVRACAPRARAQCACSASVRLIFVIVTSVFHYPPPDPSDPSTISTDMLNALKRCSRDAQTRVRKERAVRVRSAARAQRTRKDRACSAQVCARKNVRAKQICATRTRTRKPITRARGGACKRSINVPAQCACNESVLCDVMQ